MRGGTWLDGRSSGRTIGKHEKGIVGRGVAINADGIEGTRGDVAKSFLEEPWGDVGIGGDKRERGGHVGMDHARALGATHQMDAFSGHPERASRRFWPRVCRADGEGKFGEGASGRTAVFGHARERTKDLFQGQGNTNYAGGTDEDFLGMAAEAQGSLFDRFCRGSVTHWTGGTVGVASVDDDGAHASLGGFQMGFGDDHRRGHNKVLREDGGGGCRNITGEEGQIERTGLLEAASSGRETECAREGSFGRGLSHGRRVRRAQAVFTEGTSDPPRGRKQVREGRRRS